MASNLLSRLLPSASDEPLDPDDRGHHARSRPAAHLHTMDIDEENLEARFEPQDLDHLLADAESSHMGVESMPFLSHAAARRGSNPPQTAASDRSPSSRSHPIDDDNEVPESLLLEGGRDGNSPPPMHRHTAPSGLPPPVPGPSTRHTRAQWDATRRQQRLHSDNAGPPSVPRWAAGNNYRQFTSDPKERALWRWVNVSDLDPFLREVYDYYLEHGIYSILLKRVLALLQLTFVVGFITFLSWCIDYSLISKSQKMSEVLVPQCTKKMHGMWIFALWCFIIYVLYAFVRLVLGIPQLYAMHDFYHYLLEIPDKDIQTVEWQYVVTRIMALREQNLTTASNLSPQARKLLDHGSKQRLDAVDIASRLMRQDNYMIALFNKELLDVTVPVPFLGNRHVFSETTRWHVQLAILDFVFSGPNQTFNPEFLKLSNRRDLSLKLRKRLLGVGVISIMYAPFRVTYELASYLFKYFTEYHKDPSQLGTRDFTPFAQWKFREFNELTHLFQRRRNMAYPYANHYLAQFPSDKTEQLAAFIAFVVGAFASVLFLITLLDSELFLNFEITPGKTALFWLGILTAIYRSARSTSPQEDQVRDPAYYLQTVIYHTRFEPPSWKERLHTAEVRVEFSQLYQPRVLIFAEELLSMIITPFLLIFRLPDSSERIVDFFREFSIVVDGLGVVCSYSMFPFNKGPENSAPAGANNSRGGKPDQQEARLDYFKTKDEKMMRSYYGFVEAYDLEGKKANKTFYPPPQFPNTFGTMSQTAHPLEMSTRAGPAGRQGLYHRNPRGARDEPMSSALMDLHHLPSASAIRGSPRQAPMSRYRPGLANQGTELPNLSRQNSRIEEESAMEDSWRMGGGRFGQDEVEEVREQEGSGDGVLKLLKQFSKAQVDGRGVGGI